MPNSLKCRLKNLVRNGLLRECDLKRIIVIPPNATNGDVIKAMFPDIGEPRFYGMKKYMYDTTWWNAPYKGVE